MEVSRTKAPPFHWNQVIFEFLDPSSLFECESVCREFSVMLSDQHQCFWKDQFERFYIDPKGLKNDSASWKKNCLQGLKLIRDCQTIVDTQFQSFSDPESIRGTEVHSFFSKNAKIIARFVLDEHQRRQFSNGPNLFSWMMAKWLLMDKLLAENWEIALSPNQDLENVFKVFSGIHHPMLLFNSDEISSALDALAQQAREISPHLDFSCSSIDVEAKLRALNQVFHSNEFGPAGHLEFYHISRSCMSCLLKQRKGIPISLAAVYLCLAKRIGLEICGINSPQFFLLKEKTTRTFIKCYPTIELMTGEQAAQFLTNEMNVIASAEALLTMESCTHVDWALRMLSNVAHSRRSTVHAERIDSIYFQIQSEISRIYLIQQQRMFPHQLTRE